MEIITIIGLAAAVCTTISFIPQIYKTIKTKNTKDISLGMYLVLLLGVLLWLTYGILDKSFPIIVSNLAASLLVLTILALKLKYK